MLGCSWIRRKKEVLVTIIGLNWLLIVSDDSLLWTIQKVVHLLLFQMFENWPLPLMQGNQPFLSVSAVVDVVSSFWISRRTKPYHLKSCCRSNSGFRKGKIPGFITMGFRAHRCEVRRFTSWPARPSLQLLPAIIPLLCELSSEISNFCLCSLGFVCGPLLTLRVSSKPPDSGCRLKFGWPVSLGPHLR